MAETKWITDVFSKFDYGFLRKMLGNPFVLESPSQAEELIAPGNSGGNIRPRYSFYLTRPAFRKQKRDGNLHYTWSDLKSLPSKSFYCWCGKHPKQGG